MEQVYITDKAGNKKLPITHMNSVRDSQGNPLPSILGAFEDEVRGLVDTPHENYVTVLATSQTTAATDVLPASGQSADTIYRVGCWDGSSNTYDVTKYSEYAWDDVSIPNKYIFLGVKSQIDEVFDITVYKNNTEYANLAAALGTNGANVPAEIRRGGMSVKYVQNTDHNYVQFSYMGTSTADADFSNLANWKMNGTENVVLQSASSVEIHPNVFNVWGEVASLTISFAAGISGYVNEYMFQFTCPSAAATTLTLPGTIIWANDDELEPEAGYTYQVSVVDNLAVYAGWEAQNNA